MTFSIDNLSTVSATEIELDPKVGTLFKLKYEDNKYPVKIKDVLGNQQIYPIIAAVAVGLARNISIDNILE